jgi:hypothetical protein
VEWDVGVGRPLQGRLTAADDRAGAERGRGRAVLQHPLGAFTTTTLVMAVAESPKESTPFRVMVRMPRLWKVTCGVQPLTGNGSEGLLLVQVSAEQGIDRNGSFGSNELPLKAKGTPRFRFTPELAGTSIETEGGRVAAVTPMLSLACPPSSSVAVTVILRGPGLEKVNSIVGPWPITPSWSEVQTTSAQHPS